MTEKIIKTEILGLSMGARYVAYEADDRGEKLWVGRVVASWGGMYVVIEQDQESRLALVRPNTPSADPPRTHYRLLTPDFKLWTKTPLLVTPPEEALDAALFLADSTSMPDSRWRTKVYGYVVACEHGWCHGHTEEEEGYDVAVESPAWVFGQSSVSARTLRTIRLLLEMSGRLCDSLRVRLL